MNPFAQEHQAGRAWFKGNLHTHTTNSDGMKTVGERLDEYSAAGYDFLSITDHHRISAVDPGLVPDGLTVIPGVELHPANPFGGPMYHLLVHNVTSNTPVEGKTPQQVIDEVREQGGIVWLAHPYWHDVSIERDVLPLNGLCGIEVFNTTCARNGRGESSVQWDQWMKYLGSALPAIATDDSHSRPTDGDDRFQGFTYAFSTSADQSDILSALTSGMSYSSTGPQITGLTASRQTDSDWPSIVVDVHCSPAVRVNIICDRFGRDFPLGPSTGEFEHATIEIKEVDRLRVEVIDRLGQKAWTNSIPTAELLAR